MEGLKFTNHCKKSYCRSGVACRMQKLLAANRAGDGAPTVLIQNLTGGELLDQDEIFISSCQSCGETSFQARIYAIIGFILSISFTTISVLELLPVPVL